MPDTALTYLADITNIEKQKLRMELENFAKMYPNLIIPIVKNINQIYKQNTKIHIINEDSSDDLTLEDTDEVAISVLFCKFNLLHLYILNLCMFLLIVIYV